MLKEVILMSIILCTGCSDVNMDFIVFKEVELSEVPSGSGITRYNGNYLAIGDDSPYLFTLDEDFKVIGRILLIDNTNERIPKPEKPDNARYRAEY
jgi:hypothetical protein